MFGSNVSCPLYDTQKHRCSDYENRTSLIPQCSVITPDNVMQLYQQKVLSDRCNYVRHIRGQELLWDVEPKKLQAFDNAPLNIKMQYWRLTSE